MHSQSGVADVTTPDELGSLRVALRLLSYLPDNNRSIAPFFPTSDPIDRYKPDEELLFRRTFSNASGINSPLDVSLYLQQVVDHGEFFELQPERAPNLMTAFGRLSSWLRVSLRPSLGRTGSSGTDVEPCTIDTNSRSISC